MKKEIIKLLSSHPKHSYGLRDVVLRLNIDPKKKHALKSALTELVKAGEIIQKKGNRYTIGKKSMEKTGRLTVTQKGFGFVIVSPDEPDIFVSRVHMRNAIHGDNVKVSIIRIGRDGRVRGKIVQIITRGVEKFVGPVFKKYDSWYQSISPVNPERGIQITGKQASNLQQGQVVVTRVKDWGTAVSPIKVKVEKVLGQAKDPAIDFDIIKEKFFYTEKFPEKVNSEVESFTDKQILLEMGKRKDLRHLKTFTIDPDSAKDFDDALSIEKTKNGFSLWVHIADVSHFVAKGSETDREAMKRSNSVYFTEGVIPMLPDVLSSNLCSLRPNEDRLAVSVNFILSDKAEIQQWHATSSVIHSNERFSYQSAQKIVEKKEKHALGSELFWLKDLTEKLFEQRMAKGSIDFDIPEPIFILNDGGIPHEIRPSERLTSHRIVEECMLLANMVIAEGFGKKDPFVFRVHGKPAESDVEKLILILKNIGINVPADIKPSTSGGMRNLLLLVEDSPHKNLIDGIALRSMTKAKYSTKRKEHFGLAFSHYTHFTSPIRRYPDLLVHRLMKERLFSKKSQESSLAVDQLSAALEIANEMEMKAQKAEREYIKLKQLRWLREKIGEIFPGIISGVISIGFFVELKESLAEGLVHIDTLDFDDYRYDDDHYRLVGKNTGKIYQLGQEVKIKVISVDLDQQKANFYLET